MNVKVYTMETMSSSRGSRKVSSQTAAGSPCYDGETGLESREHVGWI